MSTRTFELNKLVRDGIVVSSQAMGGEVESVFLSGEQLEAALVDKIIEEATEFQQSKALGELADIVEATFSAAGRMGCTKEDLLRVVEEKRVRIGSFVTGTYVHTVKLPSDSEMAEYYASQPDRFPEIKQ